MSATSDQQPHLTYESTKNELQEPSRGPADIIWDLTNGHYVPRCLHVLAELGVADALGNSPASAEELAEKVGAQADTLSRMLRAVAAYGVFVRQDEHWSHTPASELLRSDHHMSMRAFVRMIGSEAQWRAAGALLETARTGRSAAEVVLGASLWDYYRQHPEEGRIFDEAMAAKSHADIALLKPVLDLSSYATVADIGGGRGHFLAAFLESAPATEGVLFDLPEVVAAAPDHPRVTKRAGDFFRDPLPSADAYILSVVLHDWPDAEAVEILSAIRRAAPPHAELLVLESPLPEVPSPHRAIVLDVIMLAATTGRERTIAEYAALLTAAGFEPAGVFPTAGTVAVIKARAV